MHRKVMEGLLVAFMVGCLPHFVQGAVQQREDKTVTVSKEKAAVPQPRSSDAFRVEYSVREMEDGKRINSRAYKLLVQKDEWARVRVGSRVPYLAGEKEIQYADVGINIDCRIREERDTDVTLLTTFDSSSLAREDRVVGQGMSNPVFRHVRAESASAIPFGKPTMINVVDDVVTSHQYEIEVTVTKVK
jgi:hypothetical protein